MGVEYCSRQGVVGGQCRLEFNLFEGEGQKPRNGRSVRLCIRVANTLNSCRHNSLVDGVEVYVVDSVAFFESVLLAHASRLELEAARFKGWLRLPLQVRSGTMAYMRMHHAKSPRDLVNRTIRAGDLAGRDAFTHRSYRHRTPAGSRPFRRLQTV